MANEDEPCIDPYVRLLDGILEAFTKTASNQPPAEHDGTPSGTALVAKYQHMSEEYSALITRRKGGTELRFHHILFDPSFMKSAIVPPCIVCASMPCIARKRSRHPLAAMYALPRIVYRAEGSTQKLYARFFPKRPHAADQIGPLVVSVEYGFPNPRCIARINDI